MFDRWLCADIYSYGILLWEIATGKIPFDDQNEQQIILGVSQGTLRPPIPSDCHEDFAHLMTSCWAQDAKLRPTSEEVLISLREMYSVLNPSEDNKSIASVIRVQEDVSIPIERESESRPQWLVSHR